jgi:hypothetical protein
MDMDENGATDLMMQSILFWSSANRVQSPGRPARDKPEYYEPAEADWTQYQKGEDRLDDLIATIGHEIAVCHVMKQWKRVEARLALLAAELRYRVFQHPEDAFHAASNMVSTFLWSARFELRNGKTHREFMDEFLQQLRSRLVHDTALLNCIRKYFRHPS